MISVPFLNSTNFGLGPDGDRTANLLNIQPVIPLFNGRLITRTIFAIPSNPDYSESSGSKTGFGDILFSAFYAPKSKNLTWGVGPAISFPTGGENFGSGKWAAGPSLVVNERRVTDRKIPNRDKKRYIFRHFSFKYTQY